MHTQDDKPILRRVAQKGFHKGQIVGADAPGIAVGPVLMAQPIHIVEHDESGLPIFEGVGGGAEHPAPGGARRSAIRSGEIEVVIARQIPPGRADLCDDFVVALEQPVIIAHKVAQRQAESCAQARKAIGDLGAQIVELHIVGRLRIGEHQDVETCVFGDAFQREIEAAPCVRLMVDARQHRLWIARRRPARRLDDEDGGLAIGRQGVAPAFVGQGDVPSVRDANAGQAHSRVRSMDAAAQQGLGGAGLR